MADKPIQDIRRESQRGITLTLSPGTVVSGVTVLCAGFVLVFILGVLMGRGYNLEAAIPALEKVMPRGGETQPPTVVARQEEETVPGPRPEKPAPPSAPAALPPAQTTAALAPQDNTKTPPAETKPPGKPVAQAPAKPAEKPAAKPPAKPETAPAKPRAATAAPPSGQAIPGRTSPGQTAPVRTSAAATAPNADAQVYRYVYQAAAYRDEPSCDKFVAELKKAGFQARTLKTVDGASVWYRTMIDFTGKPDDTDALRAALRNRGIPKLILKSKTPVGR